MKKKKEYPPEFWKSRIFNFCPQCGEQYFHICAYAWCALPCNKYWGTEDFYREWKKWKIINKNK